MYEFTIGEKVTVLSKELIAQTLDSEKKLDNCLFMEQMEKYCGQSHMVLKVVKNAYDFGKRKLIMNPNPIYILENLMCDGKVDIYEQVCDKSCFLLWHQSWLKKSEF